MNNCSTKTFLLVLILSIDKRRTLANDITVVFNGAKFGGQLNLSVVKDSFQEVAKTLPPNNLRFVYKDLNSSFCDIQKFLTLLSSTQFDLLVLIDDCPCEKKYSQFVDLLNKTFVSNCEQSMLTVDGSLGLLLEYMGLHETNILAVSPSASGLEFYDKFSSYLDKNYLELQHTFWLTSDKERTKNDVKNNHEYFKDIDKREVNVVVALEDAVAVENSGIVDAVREINGNLLKVGWIFPHVNRHAEISSLFRFDDNASVLTLYKDRVTNCKSHVCHALRTVMQRTFDVMQNCLSGNENQADKIDECLEINKHEIYSLNQGPERPVHQRNYSIDVLKMERDELFNDNSWQPIATRNSDALSKIDRNKIKSDQKLATFHVPVIEYDPWLVKHDYIVGTNNDCPHGTLVCYGSSGLKRSTAINYEERYCCTGITVDLVRYMQDSMPFRFKLYFPEHNRYGTGEKDNWYGIVEDVKTGVADLALDLALSAKRCSYLNCSFGYHFIDYDVVAKILDRKGHKRDSFASVVSSFEVFLVPFQAQLLLVVFVAFNIFVFLLWATDKICLHYRNRRLGRNDKFLLLESMSFVWAIAFGRDIGDSKKPSTVTARYASCWLAFLGLIFTNVYVAKLMSQLVKEDVLLPFNSLKDPKIHSEKLSIGILSGGSEIAFFRASSDPGIKKVFKIMEANVVPSFEDGVESVRNGTLDGFVADRLSLQTAVNEDKHCSLSLIGKHYKTRPIGFLFRHDWPWARRFQLFELDMNEMNVSTTLFWRYMRHRACTTPGGLATEVGVVEMSGLFAVIPITIAYCIACLIFEIFWARVVTVYLGQLCRNGQRCNETDAEMETYRKTEAETSGVNEIETDGTRVSRNKVYL